jgi:hypothetical protein
MIFKILEYVKKRPWLVMPLIAVLYLIIMAPMSWSGASNDKMLAVFNLDEYAQYQDILYRVESWNLFEYREVQYGQLFVLISFVVAEFFHGVSSFTGKWDITAASIFTLRELCIASYAVGCIALVKVFFDDCSEIRKIIIYAVLLLVAGGFTLNNQWKPDQFVFLACMLGLLWISKSIAQPANRKALFFGVFFFGLAAGLKAYGWFAAPLIVVATVLVYGVAYFREIKNILTVGAKLGLGFIAGFLVGQPVMVWPPYAWEVFNRLLISISNTTVANEQIPISKYLTDATIKNWYVNALHTYYGHWLFLCLVIFAVLAGFIFSKTRRSSYMTVLLWFVPLSIYIITQVRLTGEQRYWAPICMPMIAGALCAVLTTFDYLRNKYAKIAVIFCALAILIPQMLFFVREDVETWRKSVGREETAPSILFFNKIWRTWLSKLPSGKSYIVFRDPYIYFPYISGMKVRMVYKETEYKDINAQPTDILLLQVDYIKAYASNENLELKKSSARLWGTYTFYSDARDDKVKGFKKIYQDGFGMFFVSDALYQKVRSIHK